MGWVAFDAEPGDKRFSQIIECPDCGHERQQARLASICGLTPEMREWTFANTARLPGKEEAWDCCAWVATNPQWAITLTGSFGVGKTRLLACTVNACRAAGHVSVYTTMAELLDHLRAAYAPGAPQSFDATWERVCAATVLAIDELDRWNPTPWAAEKFFELIDVRYRAGAERCTLLATNADVDSLPGYLASRLRDRRSRVIAVGGFDMRRIMPK